MRFAEVIGDPVAQSLSPAIHRHWLEALGIDGDYRASRVSPDELPDWLAKRRADPDWLGCNATIPHKERVLALLDEVEPDAAAIGAVNCLYRRGDKLVGANSDVEGIAAALDDTKLEGERLALIGGGGAARAAIAYAARRRVAALAVVVRDPIKAQALRSIAPHLELTLLTVAEADEAFDGAAAIVNSTPLGMAGAAPMPPDLLAALGNHGGSATLFDMVYKPRATPFLALAKGSAERRVEGLVMLVGQARRAFHLFFGAEPPADDAALRDRLATLTGGSAG
ncbi:shikimate dehydrogenase [Sphingomonas ginkgonis]|uniref:Shikimate dehydrogenase (NADP(+)) n=1 Tax=Sphingomonas ginkgonis TaxID=2315330 RepID=A0A3R9X5X6_9SPHN|nr:shikimate dehydrogenase [Sphingomonas ginkgonis]RST29538.1 shikimate dehydrogenase [Sphingomonas ginkgonis]